jgi:predicted nuclease of predicted toxin-antitoxin system
MRFKVDENLPIEVAELLRRHQYDAMTVVEQCLAGQPDPHIAHVCQTEQRVLITLDFDFADIRCYPPADYVGLIVLRPTTQSVPAVLSLLQRLLPLLRYESLVGALWIVDERRVWIRGGEVGPVTASIVFSLEEP